MASTSRQTMLGFSGVLDWRPTSFVDPFPPTSACSACGLVPSSVATLPCRHHLCQHCYDRSGGNRGHCPLDQEQFQNEDVVWSYFNKESLLGRKVRCWNAQKGCDVEDVFPAMVEHFANTCQFHAVNCPRCGNNTLRRDIVHHLDAGCAVSSSDEKPLEESFANAFSEVKEALGKIAEAFSQLGRNLGRNLQRTISEESFVAQSYSVVTTPASIDVDSSANALQERRCACWFRTQLAFARFRSKLSEHIRLSILDAEQTMNDVIAQQSKRILLALKGKIMEDLGEEQQDVQRR